MDVSAGTTIQMTPGTHVQSDALHSVYPDVNLGSRPAEHIQPLGLGDLMKWITSPMAWMCYMQYGTQAMVSRTVDTLSLCIVLHVYSAGRPGHHRTVMT